MRFENIKEFRNYIEGFLDANQDMVSIDLSQVEWLKDEMDSRVGITYDWDWVKKGKIYLVANTQSRFIITKHPDDVNYPEYIWWLALSEPRRGPVKVDREGRWDGEMFAIWKKELLWDSTPSFLNWLEESPLEVKQ